MTEDDAFTDAGPSREYGRVLLVLAAIAAVGLAALFVPVLTSGGAGGGPIGSLVPKPPGATPPGDVSGGGSAGSLEGGGFGALNPGDSTDIGGDRSAFRDQEPGTHFVVESPQAGYWRTGTYATYTGSGWERAGEATPIDGTIPGGGPSRTTVSYTVELKRAAGSLPTMYRPTRVSLSAGSADLSATEAGAVRAAEPLQFGTRYDATSARPVRDPSVLRGAGRDYPDAIEERYTQLPASTRDELAPITERISREAGAETAYGTAAAVERWIRTEKEYSLEVPPPGEDVAVEYVYDMEKGYCEYAATGMVTMLRSQGIPARYVVGYSTGRQVAPDRYQVLSMNAHAWVEVYFPDVGWVRFDPTPPDARRATEERAFENQTDMEYEQEATPTRTPTPPSDTPTPETPTPTRTPTPDGPAPYRVEFNRSLAPGATVAATVTRGGTVQSGVTVLFNDRRIGRTDATGTVVGEVPYSRNVTVRVRDPATPAESVVPPPDAIQPRPSPPVRPTAGVGRDRSRFPAAGPPAPFPTRERASQADNGSVAGTYELPTEGNLTLSGELVTEGEVVLTATVGGTPIRDAPVSVDGDQVTRTNRRGRAVLTLPSDPGNATITVSRGEISANRTVTLPELAVSVSPSIALPGAPARATVRLGNGTAGNATVLVAGKPVGSVGPNGTVAFGLPLALAPTVTAEGYGQTAQVTVSGIRTNLGLVGIGVLLAAVLTVVASRRTDTPIRTLLSRALAALRRLPELFTALVVRMGELLGAALEALLAVPGQVLAAVRDLLAGRRTPGQLLAAARAAVVGVLAGFRSRATDVRARAGGVTATDDDAPEVTLGDAWRRFLSYVSVREPSSRTPGELARHAVEADGLPPDAVRTLRDDYRAVEYGARDPDERLRRVEAALDHVEQAVRAQEATAAVEAEESAAPGSGSGAPATDDDNGTRAADGEDVPFAPTGDGDGESTATGADPGGPTTEGGDQGGADSSTGGGAE